MCTQGSRQDGVKEKRSGRDTDGGGLVFKRIPYFEVFIRREEKREDYGEMSGGGAGSRGGDGDGASVWVPDWNVCVGRKRRGRD